MEHVSEKWGACVREVRSMCQKWGAYAREVRSMCQRSEEHGACVREVRSMCQRSKEHVSEVRSMWQRSEEHVSEKWGACVRSEEQALEMLEHAPEKYGKWFAYLDLCAKELVSSKPKAVRLWLQWYIFSFNYSLDIRLNLYYGLSVEAGICLLMLR